MKFIYITTLLIATTASARQYIQCAPTGSTSSDRIVVNLDGKNSTLYITNGVHLNDEDRISVLKDLEYSYTDLNFTEYIADGKKTKEYVQIPTAYIDIASNYFNISLRIERVSDGYQVTKSYSCFSSLH